MATDLSESKPDERANDGPQQMERERLGIAVEYLGYLTHPDKATAELIAQKRAQLQTFIEFLRAFTDESRMDIILFLTYVAGPDGQLVSYTVSEIAERFNISLSTVSHHLQELKRVGIVTVERQGKERYYRADMDFVLEKVGIWHRRLLAKRETLRQGRMVCPADIELEITITPLENQTQPVVPKTAGLEN